MNDNQGHPLFESKLCRFAIAIVIFGLFILAVWSLNRELTHFQWNEMWASIRETHPAKLGMATVFAVLSYASVAGYFFVSFRYAGRSLSRRDTISFSVIINSFAANLGAGAVTSNLVRARLLSTRGYTLGEGVKSALAHAVFVIFGQTLLTGAVLCWPMSPLPLTMPAYLPPPYFLGAFLLIISLAFTAFVLFWKKPVKFRNWVVTMPPKSLFLTGMGFGVIDWIFAAYVVVVLLPDIGLPAGHLIAVVLVAHLVAVISHVPGGLGVFESVIFSMLPKEVSQSELIGSLLIYRVLYLLTPFAVSIVLYASLEIKARLPQGHFGVVKALGNQWSPFVSELIAILVFVSGVVLLFSGSTPIQPERLILLHGIIPLSFLEVSHFLGSITGAFLMILAWSVRRRVNAAWWATILLLSLAILFSLAKGLDYEESLFLGAALAIVISLRDQFYRRATLFAHRVSPGWWILVLSVVVTTTWIGFLIHRNVEYKNDLWWQFALDGDAPRFLRATVGVAVVLLTVALFELFGYRPVKDSRIPGPPDETVCALLESSQRAVTGLAWLGDKRFLLSPDKQAALMYGVWGSSRIVLGDPFGPEDSWEGLLWNLLDECDMDDQRPVFFRVAEENARHYLDIGFQLFKMGEEARVPLTTFSFESSRGKDLRDNLSKLERNGCVFAVIPKGEFKNHAPELRAVSNAWLEENKAREKSFSHGSFDESFLDFFPIAVVRLNNEIVAFANLLCSASGRHEFSIDLMRFDPKKTPSGTMQFLFTHLILWGRQQGYQWFSLGLAPLSGLESRSMAPLWHKVGGGIFCHAEHFYNFQGLRAFKEKFDPAWASSYVALRSGMEMPAALLDGSLLIGGGVLGKVKT